MLKRTTISNLKKQSWESFIRREFEDGEGISGGKGKGNKSQNNSRYKDQVNTAFEHLSLLAEKMPDDLQREVFSYKNLRKLLEGMSKYEKDGYILDRKPNLRIAEYLVTFGLDMLLKEFQSLEKHNPSLSQLTIDHLERTKAICQDIAQSAEFVTRKNELKEKKYDYLFSFRDFYQRPSRIKDYLLKLIEKTNVRSMGILSEAVDISTIRKDKDNNSKYVAVIFNGIIDEDLGYITLQVIKEVKGDSLKRSVDITVELVDGYKFSQTLDVMEKDNDYLVYKNSTRSKEYP
jgi:hypothetical protein